MKWYYAESDEQVGPVSEEDFQSLVRRGKIGPHTLVWNATMADWQKYGSVSGTAGSAGIAEGDDKAFCSQCGRAFSHNDMIRYGDSWVCASCKPVFIQKLKEGVTRSGTLEYAGFWIRFGAKVIDWIILALVNLLINIPVGLLMAFTSSKSGPGAGAVIISILSNFFNFGFGIAYVTFFLGKYGATLGKMACRLRVVTPEGGKVTYLRAFGRYFGELVSGITLTIGYIIAAFDEEKRALHDRICSTRVVRR
ncbi:MAG: RDD family protein [Deltaproteobacteria bacterium]|nr:RDD family protein [Deltaproteobacteria bacterium]